MDRPPWSKVEFQPLLELIGFWISLAFREYLFLRCSLARVENLGYQCPWGALNPTHYSPRPRRPLISLLSSLFSKCCLFSSVLKSLLIFSLLNNSANVSKRNCIENFWFTSLWLPPLLAAQVLTTLATLNSNFYLSAQCKCRNLQAPLSAYLLFSIT